MQPILNVPSCEKPMMARENLAAALNVQQLQYPDEPAPELIESAKANRLVIIFGASDDLMELRGAVYDELGAYNGTTAYFDKDGLLQNDCENDDCPHFYKLKVSAAKVDAIWSPNATQSWGYKTAIPHSEFDIHEDGELYCRGIVICLDELA